MLRCWRAVATAVCVAFAGGAAGSGCGGGGDDVDDVGNSVYIRGFGIYWDNLV